MLEEKDIYRDTPVRLIEKMEDEHFRLKVGNSNLNNSIFTISAKLIGADNENPRYYIELVRSLHLNEFNVGSGNNLSYSVKRIIKGLGSTRLYSQCGCFASLSCLLKYQECSVEDILHALEKEQQSAQGITKAEAVAQNAGCLLACGAIIHSGMFLLQSPEIKRLILKKLIDVGKKKTYFSAVTYKFAINAVNLVNEEEFKNIVWPVCKSELLNTENEYNFDQLHLLMTCIVKCPSKVEKWLQKNSSSVELILEKTVGFLGSKYMKNDHPIYHVISQFLSQNIKFLAEYWQSFLNEKDTSNFCKDKVIVLFFHLMEYSKDGKIVPLLLQPQFLTILVKVLSSKKKKLKEQGDYFNKAKSSLTLMLNLVNSEATSQKVRFEVIIKLLLYPTNLKFDMKTGLKCVQSLISYLNIDFVTKLIEILQKIITGMLKKVVNERGDTEEWNIREKELALNFLVKMLNHSTLTSLNSVKIDQIKFIFEQAFSKSKSTSQIRIQARESFYKSIILHMPSLKDLLFLLDELAVYINNCLKNNELEVEEEIVEMWEKHFSVIHKLMQKSNEKLFVSVHVLLIYMGLQLFVDKELAKSGIEELLACYEHLKKIHSKKSMNQKNKKDSINFSEDPHWTEVITDLILSLLSRDNKLWRHVVSCIFTQMVIYATPTALQQIIEALEMTTDNEVLEPVEANDLEKNGENDVLKCSVSEINGKENLESKEMTGDHTAQNKNTECLKLALHNALNYSTASFSDNESVDMDLMDSDDEKRLNHNLSEAFRLFKKGAKEKKNKQTKEEEALTHFKLRVLDLVEIYIKNNPSIGGCLDLIRILFDIMKFSIKDPHQRSLLIRADSILKQICSIRVFSDVTNINQKVIRKLFKMILNKNEISTPVFIEISPRISDCIVFLVRCSQFLPRGKETPLLVNECTSLLKTLFLSRDSKFPSNIFEKLFNTKWKGNVAMVKTLFELLTASEMKIFKKLKILELLKVFYKNENFHASCEENIKEELNIIEENFIENFINYLKDFEKDSEKYNNKKCVSFFSNILALVNIRNSRHKKSSSWESLILTMAQINTINSSKKTRSQLANLVRLFNLSAETILDRVNSNGRLLKRKSSRSQMCSDFEPKKKKKKKTSLNSNSQ